ncbi:Metallothionein expression activator [Chytridiales sp. JEL 0842]|nr:Metallothionein expression activator [Chytridiales sp. JEL 0842]
MSAPFSLFAPSLAINTSDINDSTTTPSIHSASTESTTTGHLGVGGSFQEEFSLGLTSPVKLDDNHIPSILLDSDHQHGYGQPIDHSMVSSHGQAPNQLSTPPTDATFGELGSKGTTSNIKSHSSDRDVTAFFKVPSSTSKSNSGVFTGSSLSPQSAYYARNQPVATVGGSKGNLSHQPYSYNHFGQGARQSSVTPPSPALSTNSDGSVATVYFNRSHIHDASLLHQPAYPDDGAEITPTRFLTLSELDDHPEYTEQQSQFTVESSASVGRARSLSAHSHFSHASSSHGSPSLTTHHHTPMVIPTLSLSPPAMIEHHHHQAYHGASYGTQGGHLDSAQREAMAAAAAAYMPYTYAYHQDEHGHILQSEMGVADPSAFFSGQSGIVQGTADEGGSKGKGKRKGKRVAKRKAEKENSVDIQNTSSLHNIPPPSLSRASSASAPSSLTTSPTSGGTMDGLIYSSVSPTTRALQAVAGLLNPTLKDDTHSVYPPAVNSHGAMLIPPSATLQCEHPGCGKTFQKVFNLRAHMKIHALEKVFTCTLCESSFRRSHDLRRHLKSLHTGVRAYPCFTCPKSFSRLDALKRHVSRERSKCFIDLKEGGMARLQNLLIQNGWVPPSGQGGEIGGLNDDEIEAMLLGDRDGDKQQQLKCSEGSDTTLDLRSTPGKKGRKSKTAKKAATLPTKEAPVVHAGMITRRKSVVLASAGIDNMLLGL